MTPESGLSELDPPHSTKNPRYKFADRGNAGGYKASTNLGKSIATPWVLGGRSFRLRVKFCKHSTRGAPRSRSRPEESVGGHRAKRPGRNESEIVPGQTETPLQIESPATSERAIGGRNRGDEDLLTQWLHLPWVSHRGTAALGDRASAGGSSAIARAALPYGAIRFCPVEEANVDDRP